MKRRWLSVGGCLILGLATLIGGLLVPAHLRGLDIAVLQNAQRTGDTLLEREKALLQAQRLGAAQLLVIAAHDAGIPGWDQFGKTVTNAMRARPNEFFWGNDAATSSIFKSPATGSFAAFLVQTENREAALDHLRSSNSSVIQELLHTRSLNVTALFPAPASGSGQAYDAALALCALLLDRNRLPTSLSDHLLTLALQANRGQGSEPLEQILLDFVSLGDRFNWDQLAAFVAEVPDAITLHQLADAARNTQDRLPALFAAVQLSGTPAAVGRYLAKFPQSGLQDINSALCYGGAGVKELADSGRQIYQPQWRLWLPKLNPFGWFYDLAAIRSLHKPDLAMAVKWLLYLTAGFLFALAPHFLMPAAGSLEQPLQVRGFHLLRELLFALGFLLVVLLLTEPFLVQERQTGNFSLRLHLPTVAGSIPAGIAGLKHNFMNPTILLTLLVFFVLQLLIYVSCLVKLAEIRRQQVPPGMKLKLLENEDHLFDAGLYLGFVGTIVSLIIASLGLVKFSLMAAYSSTSFGIIFVVIFKIFSLRPARRKLLMEAEMSAPAAPAAAPKPALAA